MKKEDKNRAAEDFLNWLIIRIIFIVIRKVSFCLANHDLLHCKSLAFGVQRLGFGGMGWKYL